MQAPRVLHYVLSPTRVGRVLVLMSHRGVVDIVPDMLGTTPRDLFRSLGSRFPNARFVPDDGTHGSWAAAVAARIDGTRHDFGVPIDLAWSAPSAHLDALAPAEHEYAS